MKEKNILIAHEGRDGSRAFYFFFKQKYYCSLFLFFAMGDGGWLMSRPMWGLFYLFYRVRLLSPPCLLCGILQAHVGNSWWMDTGLELWPGITFLCWFWAVPPPLSPWRFIVLNFQVFSF